MAIGNAEIRQKLKRKREIDNKKIPILIHSSTVIARDVEIGSGLFLQWQKKW